MEIFLIFFVLIGLFLPLYTYNRYINMKEQKAQRLIDRLCGIDRFRSNWPGPN